MTWQQFAEETAEVNNFPGGLVDGDVLGMAGGRALLSVHSHKIAIK